MKTTKRVAEGRKRRYLELRREGRSQAEARRLAVVGRTAAWAYDKLLGTGTEEQKDQPAPPRPDLHDVERRDDRREDLDETPSVIPPNLLEALQAPDEPAEVEKPGSPLGLPGESTRGDREEPTGDMTLNVPGVRRGFGTHQCDRNCGHPEHQRRTFVAGRDRTFARGLNPSEASLGVDPDLRGSTMRPLPETPGSIRTIDPTQSQRQYGRRRRHR